jgi:uncharacterized protein YllA (UPF0747 family)
LAAKLVPSSLHEEFERVRGVVESSITGLQSELVRFDPTLADAARKSGAKILYQVDKLRTKTAREAMRRDERAAKDAALLSNMIYPHRHFQERFYSIVPFLAKHGPDLPQRLMAEVQLACSDHMLRVV